MSNDAFRLALDIYNVSSSFGVLEDVTEPDIARDRFLDGRCALTIDYADLAGQAMESGMYVLWQVVDADSGVQRRGCGRVLV